MNARKRTPETQLLPIIGGVSKPSKMPCASWSIPATTCKLGALLAQREGSTCSGCYALKGMYSFPGTQAAMHRRLGKLREALADPAKADAWVNAFATMLRQRGAKGVDVFRWHDSGDLQSVEHLGLLVRIALLAPDVRFWLPTREVGMVRDFLSSGGVLPANMVVRLSVPMRDMDPAGLIAKLVASEPQVTVSGVHTGSEPSDAYESCDAYTRDGECGPCRRCWDADIAISYPLH